MAKYEKEIKILNIDVKEAKNKLKSLNAEFKGDKEQKIYVYDVPTIFYRYKEIEALLHSDNELIVKTNLIKLQNLFNEITDLLEDEELNSLLSSFKVDKLSDICSLKLGEVIKILNDKRMITAFEKRMINDNKWVRLRESNGVSELTTKHVFKRKREGLQSVYECATIVSDFEETNQLLESMGIVKRSYQEKRRISYVYKGAEIEIDCWPKLDPYIEVECDDPNIIREIVEDLGYENKEIVSENTEQLYKRKNIDIKRIDNLRFE